MNGFVDTILRNSSVDSASFIHAMNDPTTREAALVEFRGELASIPQDKLADKVPPLSRNMRRQLKKLTPQLKAAIEKVRTLPEAEREQLATDLREKEPDAPPLDELTAVMPFMLEILALVNGVPEPKAKVCHEKGHDAFAVLQGLGRIPDNPFVADHFKAQLKAGKNWEKKGAWEKNTQGAMALRTVHKKGGTSTALIRALDAADAMNEQLQQQVLERLGPFTLDVSLAISAAFGDPRNTQYPLRAPVTVTTENIRNYKKFKGYGLEIVEMDSRIEQAIKDLSRLRMEFDRVKVDGREAVTIRDGKLFDIEEYIREQQLLDGTWIVLEKGWKIRPGMWENAFLTPTQRLWFSHTAREVLELSHRDNRPVEQMAKAFWVTLFICPAGTWHLDGPKEIQVELLLESTGFLLQPEHRDKDWYWKLRTNTEAALDKLIQMGAAVDWHYLPGCPLVSDQSPGIAQKWLDAKISVTDPAAIPAAERERLLVPNDDKHPYNRAIKRAAIEDQAREIREARKVTGYRRKTKAQVPLPIPEPTGTITPAALKQWRNERAIQQGEMARRLGVTQQYYSLMEREKRPITAELTKKLQAMMDSPAPD